MSALLKAMGVTIWGLIGIALVFSLMVFGFRASLLYRDARIRETPATHSSAESDTSLGLRPENRRAWPNENREADAAGIYSSERAVRATRTLFRQAAENPSTCLRCIARPAPAITRVPLPLWKPSSE
jgi:hypothetical protein